MPAPTSAEADIRSAAKADLLSVQLKRPGERRSASRTATRALDVLELFGTRRGPLRAVEICRVLNLTPSSANQLLKTMVDSGHLVFDARTKAYLPSPRLAQFSGWIVEMYGPDGALRDLIRDVETELGMVATLSTPNDLFMQIVDSAIPQGLSAERGLRVSIFGSAIGSAYLMTLDQAEVRRLAFRARVPDARVEPILTELAELRAAGFAQAPSARDDIWSVALPIPAERTRVPAVLGIAGERATVRARLADIVGAMQRAIERHLPPNGPAPTGKGLAASAS